MGKYLPVKSTRYKRKKNEEKWQCKRKFYHRHQKRGVGSCHVRSVVGADDKSPVT